MDTFTDEQLRYRIALAGVKGMNRLLAETLIEAMGDVSVFFTLSDRELAGLTGWNSRLFSDVERGNALRAAVREVEFVRQHSITPLFITDAEYPRRLAECSDAPLMLYYKGHFPLEYDRVVSIVGTRRATAYGKSFVDALVRGLASASRSTLIVSGLAYGIDIAAHRAALRYELPTVGVLAHGLHMLYPSTHRQTAVEMLGQGGLLTEYTSTQGVLRPYFLARNRIVAGMADAVVVVESGEKGGSLVTASIAESYSRDVFALPGRASDILSAGCNNLIKHNKAALITSVDDLLEAMSWDTPQPQSAVQMPLSAIDETLTADEQRLLQYLRTVGEGQINHMAVELDCPAATLSALLVELEFKGYVTPFPGGVYRPTIS